MNHRAFSRARDKIRVAERKFEAMKGAKSLGELEDAWVELLASVQVTFSRLRKATEAGPSKGWYDQVEGLRKTDALLSYIRHARNADEHTVEEVTGRRPPHISIGGPGSIYIDYLEMRQGQMRGRILGDPFVEIGFHPESVILVPVTDRGVVYNPPDRHLGRPLTDRSPLNVARLVLEYLNTIMDEAEAQFG